MAGPVLTGVNNFNTKRVRDSTVTWDISKSVPKCGGTIIASLVNCGGAKRATDARTSIALSRSRDANSSQGTTLKRAARNSIASKDQQSGHLKRRRIS